MTERQPRLIGLSDRVLWTGERGVGGKAPEEMADDLRRQWDDLYRQFIAQAPNWQRTRARIAIRITVEDASRPARPERGQG